MPFIKGESRAKLNTLLLHIQQKGVIVEEKQFIVYKITCDINNKVYIGQTSKPIQKRLEKHFSLALSEKERSDSIKLSRAIRKYGKSHFYIQELERVSNQDELDEREYFWINHHNAVKQGYNSKNVKGKCGGDTLSEHWNKEEIGRKISESKKGDLNPMRIYGGLKGERNGMYGKRGSEIHNSVKCVGVNSITGEIKIFESNREASNYVGLKSSLGVGQRIRKETKSEYKGWMFYSYEGYLKSQETTESVDSEKDTIE